MKSLEQRENDEAVREYGLSELDRLQAQTGRHEEIENARNSIRNLEEWYGFQGSVRRLVARAYTVLADVMNVRRE